MRAAVAGLAAFVAWLFLFVAASAQAQTYNHAVYLDLDRDVATGCSATTLAGTVSGAEARVSATVTGQPPIVSSVTRELCSGGTFGAPTMQPSGYPVGVNIGIGGSDVIEFSSALFGLPTNGLANLTFVSSSATGADLVVVQGVSLPGQGAVIDPAIVPATGWLVLAVLIFGVLWLVRRHPRFGASMAVLLLLGAGVVWAANFVMDGQIPDWNGVAPRASDPAGDATSSESGIDLVAVFAQPEGARLFFRSDVSDAENEAPTATAQSVIVAEESTTTITLIATDPEGAAMTFAIATAPTRGTLSAITPINATSASVQYTGDLDEVGADSFTFTASDGQATSTPATVSITLTEVNDAPIVAPQALPVVENGPNATLVGTATATDVDAGQTLAWSILSGNTGNAFAINPASGAITVADTSAVIPGNSPFALVVQALDNGTPPLSDSDTITITVTGVNDAPSFTAGPNQSVNEDDPAASITGWATAISAGPPDESGQVLTFLVSNDNNPLFSVQPAVAVDGTLTYTLAPNANGLANVSVVLQDNGGTAVGGDDTSDPQNFTITVAAVNDTPTFTAGPDQEVPQDSGPQVVSPWATGISAGPVDESAQTLTFTITNNTNIALFSAGPTLTTAGVLSYTSALGAVGSADITLTLQDNGGGVDTSPAQTFTITVTDTNEVPVPSASPPSPINVPEDAAPGTLVTTVAPNDPDVGQTHSYAFLSGNTGNVFAIDGAGAITVAGALDFEGSDDPYTLVVRVTDNGVPVLFGDISITLTLGDVNDAPLITSTASASATEDVLYTYNALRTDDDGPGQSWSLLPADSCPGASIVAGTGAYTFTPTGPTPPAACEVAIQVCDGGIPDLCDAQTTTVTITSINSAPTISNTPPPTATEDTLYSHAATLTDLDGPGQTWSLLAANTCTGAVIVPGTGAFSFTPAGPIPPAACDVAIQVCDGGTPNECDTQTTTITIVPVNDAPVISTTAPTTATEDVPYSYDADLTDPDGPGQTWSLAGTNTCAAASIVPATGTYSFTPAGPIPPSSCNVGVQVCDGGTPNECVVQTTTVSITAVNSAPVIDSTAPDATEDTLYNYAATRNDIDGPGQTWSLLAANTCTGAVIVPGTGAYSFTPAGPIPPAACDVAIQVCDGGTPNECDTQTTTITIVPVNDAPVISTTAPTTATEDLGYSYDADLTDPDGVGQTWSLDASNTCAGAAIDAGTGVYTFTPAGPAPPATCTVGVRVCDGGTPDECDSQSTSVTISAINDGPTNTVPGAQDVDEDTDLVFSAGNGNAISINDPDAGSNTVRITLAATNGVLSLDGTAGLSFTIGDGTADPVVEFTGTQADISSALSVMTFRPTLNYFGPASLAVTTNDLGNVGAGGALVDTDTVTITVNPVNDAPTATSKTHTTHSAIELEIVAASHTGELLEGAADVDDPVGDLTAVFVPGSATPAGAQVVVTNAANGSFRYDPPGGFSGVGGFQFQICDDGVPTAPVACSPATAVSVTITGPDLWFVDDNAAPGGDGGLNDPFDALTDLPAGRGDNDRIFVFAGSYPTAVHSFLPGEHLVGQGATGAFDTLLGVVVPVNGTLDARPATTGAVGDRPTLNRIVMAGANNATLRGVALSTNTDAVFINGTTGVTITESSATSTGGGININASGASAAGISFSSVTSSGGANGIVLNNLSMAGGTFNFGTGALSGHSGTSFLATGTLATVSYAGSISKTSAGRLIDISGAGAGDLTLSGNLSCITSCGTGAGNHGLRVTGRSGGALTFSGTSKLFTSSATNPGVSLTGNAGATLNFTGGGLAITTTGGTGFEASGGGVVNVTGSGNSIGSTTGAALIVDHPAAQATNLNFATVAATGATSAYGIRLNNISGAVTVSGATSIGGKTTAGIEITNSSATIAMSNASTVTIANRPSTGIRIANSSGTVGFGGTTINSSGVGTPAIRIDASSSAISFAQANINMGGAGGNENFLIGAGPNADAYTPRDNAGDGDAIYVTGLTGALTINGGTITQPGDDGIDIRNSSNLAVSNMTFIEPGRSAGAGCVDCNSSGIQAFGLTGVNSIGNSTFLRGRLRNLYISNPSGTTTLNVSGSTFDDTRGQGSPATDNLQIYASGTASAAFNISNSTFLKSATNQINAVAKGNAVITELDITGITMDNDGGPSAGIRIDAEENSQVAFNLIGNPVLYTMDENVVTVSSGGTAQLRGRIADNPDMRFTTSSPGGSIFVGMRVLSDGSTSRATVAITNNALNVNNGTDGIVLTVQGIAGARIDADVRNNQIDAAGTPGFPLEGINAFVNPQIGMVAPTKVLCLSLFDNTANNAWARAARVRAFRPTGVYMTGFTTDVATTWAGNGNVGTPVVQFVTDGGTIGAPPTPCAVPTNPLP